VPPPVAATPTPDPARSADAAPATPASKPVRMRTVVVLSEASLGAVGLVTGIVFIVARSSADDRMRTANALVLQQVGGSDPNGTACSMQVSPSGCADLNQAQQDRTRDGTLATVGFVTAGASAAAIGLTYLLWPRAAPPAVVGLQAAPGRWDLSVAGRF